jgi:spermidine/putrescine transport system substrate-binding protein
MVSLQADHPKLKWNPPDSGGMIWTDNMLIPKKGNVYTASVYMNYVYDPKVAAEIEAYVNYICPVKGADVELKKSDPDVAKNPLIFPTEDMLASVKQFDPVAVNNEKYKTKFAQLTGS